MKYLNFTNWQKQIQSTKLYTDDGDFIKSHKIRICFINACRQIDSWEYKNAEDVNGMWDEITRFDRYMEYMVGKLKDKYQINTLPKNIENQMVEKIKDNEKINESAEKCFMHHIYRYRDLSKVKKQSNY